MSQTHKTTSFKFGTRMRKKKGQQHKIENEEQNKDCSRLSKHQFDLGYHTLSNVELNNVFTSEEHADKYTRNEIIIKFDCMFYFLKPKQRRFTCLYIIHNTCHTKNGSKHTHTYTQHTRNENPKKLFKLISKSK